MEARKDDAPDRPADRGATFAPGPAEPEATPPQPASTAHKRLQRPRSLLQRPTAHSSAREKRPAAERSAAPLNGQTTLRPSSGVAGAVARAAAQGPLMPRGPGESDEVTPKTSEPSAMWPDYSPTTPPLGARPSALVAPIEPATETHRPSRRRSPPTPASARPTPTKSSPDWLASMLWPLQPRGAAATDRRPRRPQDRLLPLWRP